MANPVTSLLLRFAGRLRFPTLFFVTAALFVLDLAVPDVIPFVDEILLGLGTLLFGTLRKRLTRPPRDSSEDDTPRD
jgi:hypothetical protein